MLAQAKRANKVDIADFVKQTNFDNKLEKVNKKVTSNKKTLEAEKKLANLTKNMHKYQQKDIMFLVRIYFACDNG